MLTNNLPESHQQSQDGVSYVKADVKDKTELSKFEKWSQIIIPAGGVAVGLVAAILGG